MRGIRPDKGKEKMETSLLNVTFENKIPEKMQIEFEYNNVKPYTVSIDFHLGTLTNCVKMKINVSDIGKIIIQSAAKII